MSSPNSSYGESTSLAYGVTVFAGVMLATLGGLQILQGLAAVLKDDVFVRGVEYTYQFDVTTWGWIHMLIGVIGVAVGIGILYRPGLGEDRRTRDRGGVAAQPVHVHAVLPVLVDALIFMDIVVIWALATTLGDSGA